MVKRSKGTKKAKGPSLFEELSAGVQRMQDHREGGLRLRTHKVPPPARVTLHGRPSMDVVGSASDAVVKGSRGSANHDDLDGLSQRLVDGFEEPLELVLEERPHDGLANSRTSP